MNEPNANPDASADQIAWVEIAHAIRGHLQKAAAMMPAMNPSELQLFVGTVRDAIWLEQNAVSFDLEVELSSKRTTLD